MQNDQQEKRMNVWLQAGPAASGWMQVQEVLREICYIVPCTQTLLQMDSQTRELRCLWYNPSPEENQAMLGE